MSDYLNKLSREDIAKLEIGQTAIGRAAKWTLLLAMLATITVEPAVQHVADLRAYLAGQRANAWPRCYGIFSQAGAAWWRDAHGHAGLWQRNARLKAALDRYENALEDDSLLAATVLGPTQHILGAAGAGNEKVYVGRQGWLFYRPDIDSLTSEGCLHSWRAAGREERAGEQTRRQSDPRPAIRRFHQQLAARGIVLVVMPAPAKPSIHPEAFSSRYRDGELVQNPAHKELLDDLRRQGIRVFDPAPMLSSEAFQSSQPQYLKTDTHWRPEAMQRVADELTEHVLPYLELPHVPDSGAAETLPSQYWKAHDPPTATEASQWHPVAMHITALGDIARMLKLPAGQTLFAAESVALRQIVQADLSPWRPARVTQVLLLGDSFTNIYSQAALGWGESAGLAEQLSFELGRPIDRISRNDNGAFAAREDLIAQMTADPRRLAGIRMVIWQFAARELAVGDWKLLDLPTEADGLSVRDEGFFVPPEGSAAAIEAVVAELSAVPRPGSVAYRDHIFALRLTELRGPGVPASAGAAIVYTWSMRDNVPTAAARLAVGDHVRLRMRPWDDVADDLESFNRGTLDDLPPEFIDYAWAEEVHRR